MLKYSEGRIRNHSTSSSSVSGNEKKALYSGVDFLLLHSCGVQTCRRLIASALFTTGVLHFARIEQRRLKRGRITFSSDNSSVAFAGPNASLHRYSAHSSFFVALTADRWWRRQRRRRAGLWRALRTTHAGLCWLKKRRGGFAEATSPRAPTWFFASFSLPVILQDPEAPVTQLTEVACRCPAGADS